MTNFNVVDNFLDKEYFDILQEAIMGHNFPWLYEAAVANPGEDNEDHFYFTHRVYEHGKPSSSFYDELTPLLYELQPKAIARIRVMLYVNQGKLIVHDNHRDFDWSHKTTLIYFNTCNGYTGFGENKVQSVANRAVHFDGSHEHHSTTCTDQKVRTVMSLNYF